MMQDERTGLSNEPYFKPFTLLFFIMGKNHKIAQFVSDSIRKPSGHDHFSGSGQITRPRVGSTHLDAMMLILDP